ncbi:T9SS type B sorting domain-containing protein [Subsaximicrobium wynnwilliamsii]|uniref:T9SS type B sorting domain-containing protein n=1 Tax=Subsaximicrobium wynnwilliamsii TaxID=291179 RepID=A0A5C6ZLR6_9FLAO|nr:T9SS type B sorting domain-containing protein [Subsaximicrobium wynnwilliamsii]TXD84954.1 T9SS type B sorting domain-containing protein [Subsaximicrobium wynnwilliamsii]TXD90625.1 T9SS type B sorting domain-containing protein [Subsaximicrobium wynnwilliamsii]TXE05099.1 T9SS type B sorting domain-containing protein [Subsaximicrobium wynnwilliamsii]
MKKIAALLLLTLLTTASTFSQQEASYWYFGKNAGLRFYAGAGTVIALTDGQIDTLEGCTSISDTEGNLLFYSDGQTVWNANHQIMDNANYFGGNGLLGDPSSTSSGLIVPKPQDPSKFYVFTVDEPHHQNANAYPNQFSGTYDGGGSVPQQDDGFNNGFNYSLVDMTLDGGLGDVDPTEKNVPLVSYDINDSEEIKYKCSEKITAVKADDCYSFWVITHFTNKFYAFKVDTDGVETTPVISTVGPNVPISGYRRNALGYLKASPDGTKLAVAHLGFATTQGANAPGGVYLFDFDNDTGIVSNALELYGPENNDSPYGVEFSAENKKFYASINAGPNGIGASQVIQWDLESDDVPASAIVIHQSNIFNAGALQLGLDKRIYRAQIDFSNSNSGRFLGVINNPELTGNAANYDETGVLLDVTGSSQNLGRIGLPPFIQSLFNSQIDIIKNGLSTTELNLCTGDNYMLIAEDIAGATYIWTQDGNPLAETSYQLMVDTPGFYEVFIEPNNGECPIEGNAVVGVFDIPTATQPDDLLVCADANTNNFDLSVKDLEILDGQAPEDYVVKYFTTEAQALLGQDEIMGNFYTTEALQTIYARVENRDNPNCYALTSFTFSVAEQAQIINLEDLTLCDTDFSGDAMDGFTSIDLSALAEGILGTQDAADFGITFHNSQADADNNVAAIAEVYANSNPNAEVIFVRVENTQKPKCYVTSSFTLTINNAPEAIDSTIIQCDEDGIPEGYTIFNLNEVFDAITNNAANRQIQFYETRADLENDNDEINADAFENYVSPQIIYALVTNTQTGCSNTAEVTLETSSTASNDTGLDACDDDGTEDGFYNFNLQDAEAAILFGLPTNLDLSYYETYDNALTETDALGNSFTNSTPYNQTIYTRVENANACFGISKIELIVYELPNLLPEETVYYCLNTFPQPITLSGGLIEGIPNNYYYEWSTGETTSEIEINAAGTYSVRVTTTDGCFKDRTISVLPSNIATITNIEITDASSNNSISVLVSGEGSYQYALDNPNGSYQDSNVFENVPFGFHTVYVRDVKNDCGIVDELVSVIGFPKYFTPNGDTHNPYWQVKGISSNFQPDSQILIYDRMGKLLRELDPLGPGWDGTWNGNNMPSSDYWFVVKLQDGRTFKGHFSLKR